MSSGYRLIPLTQGLFALVSPEDYNYLRRVKWHARKDGNTFYAVRRKKRNELDGEGEFILMHRVIAESLGLLDEKHPEVDHINRNGLDNRRTNLRGVSRRQNRTNSRARGFTIDGRRKNKPFKVQTGGKHGKFVGYFATKEEAIAAYEAEKERVAQL